MLVPVLKPGDYVIVEDTNLDGREHAVAPGWGPSPYDAITHFMAYNRGIFERDLEREVKFGFSQAIAVRWREGGRASERCHEREGGLVGREARGEVKWRDGSAETDAARHARRRGRRRDSRWRELDLDDRISCR